MSIVFKDFGTAYLAAPLAVGGLVITVDNPAALPILTNSDYFYLVLQKYGDRSYVEIVKVTATAGNTYTIQRGQAGTSIRAFAAGDYAELRLTVDGLTEYISQNIATKMDKSGGGDFSGLYRFLGSNVPRIDFVRTSDDVASSLVVDFSASEGHRTIVGGAIGPNAVTPSILLRPNGYGNGAGQVKIDSSGLVDVVGLTVRGEQGTNDGSVVRYAHLSNYVPAVRKVNGRALSSDVTLSASDVKAAPEGFGLGDVQAFTVVDLNSDPLTWNGGKMGWIRATSSSVGKPEGQDGVGLLHRYQLGASSVVHILFFGHNNKTYTRFWSGTAWAEWKSSFDSTNKPGVADVTGLVSALASASGGISATNDRLVVVEGKVATLEQRKSTCLVNATGTGAPHETVVTQLPANVAINSRYVLPNPFGNNTPVICWAEVFANGVWSNTGYVYEAGGYGTRASYVQGVGVVIQTGFSAISPSSNGGGGGHGLTKTVESAPCRVFVRKLEA